MYKCFLTVKITEQTPAADEGHEMWLKVLEQI